MKTSDPGFFFLNFNLWLLSGEMSKKKIIDISRVKQNYNFTMFVELRL